MEGVPAAVGERGDPSKGFDEQYPEWTLVELRAGLGDQTFLRLREPAHRAGAHPLYHITFEPRPPCDCLAAWSLVAVSLALACAPTSCPSWYISKRVRLRASAYFLPLKKKLRSPPRGMSGRSSVPPVESKTRTHYGPVGSGRRTAGRRGGAGLGRTGRRRVDPARRQPSLLPSSESKTLSWTSIRKHEQTKSYVNRWRNEIRG